MIAASTRRSAADFTARLTAKAGLLAAARGEEMLRERGRDPRRWRAARLLWPLFTRKG